MKNKYLLSRAKIRRVGRERFRLLGKFLRDYKWVILISLLVVGLVCLGFLFLSESLRFGIEKAFRFTNRARAVESTEKRTEFILAASGSWGIAAVNSALAAAFFSCASIIIGASSAIYAIRKNPKIQLVVMNSSEVQKSEEVNHKITEYIESDDCECQKD